MVELIKRTVVDCIYTAICAGLSQTIIVYSVGEWKSDRIEQIKYV